jgi:hypothetical protein
MLLDLDGWRALLAKADGPAAWASLDVPDTGPLKETRSLSVGHMIGGFTKGAACLTSFVVGYGMNGGRPKCDARTP